MFIPSESQMFEANIILKRLQMVTSLIREKAIKDGKDPDEAETNYQCSPGYALSRLEARILMTGNAATFKCLYKGDTLIAWEKVSVVTQNGRTRMWSLLPEYAKEYGRATIAAGNTSNDIRNLGLQEKQTLLPAKILPKDGGTRHIVVVDDLDMEYSGF